MSTTIESLELEIKQNSQSAISGIDALTQSLTKLRNATKGSLGLSSIAKQLQSIGNATQGINAGAVTTLSGLAKAIQILGGVKVSSTIGKQITEISTSLSTLNIGDGANKVQELVTALQPLTTMPKSNLSSVLTQLKKLPEVLDGLDNVDMSAFSNKIQEVTNAIKPLATEMEKVSNGFSAFPTKIQKLLNSTEKIPKTNKKASQSFTDFYYAIRAGINTIKKVGTAIYGFIKKSSDYLEDVNLFTVAMGDYAESASDYAQRVSEVMGIDPGEWMRNQGLFQTLITGFGVAGESASTMSANLTQLAYDLSSFYNIDVETAMQKLKSGMAGELEPLRAIGYDLSQAKLEATAEELGIDKAVSDMTQAEKSMLRYHAIMTQVTSTHGDMARTLEQPANQLRILKAQLEMLGREIGNVFMPLLETVLPYLIAITKVLREIVSAIATLVGYEQPEIRDTGIEELASGSEATADALADSSEQAKKLKSYMLGFDELNVISPNNEGSESVDNSAFDIDLSAYSYDFLGSETNEKLNGIIESMKEWLGISEDIKSWSDLLSTNFGNILVTVGLIGASIIGWKITSGVTDLLKDTDKLKSALTIFKNLMKGLGIAAVSAVAIASASWLINNTEDTVTKIGAIISAAALVVGSILAFTGINLPLGIGLMAVGAVSMGTAIAMNTDKLSDEVKGVIAIITSAVSVALLAVGAILAFTATNIPLGIALMAGGALTMGTAIIPKWDELSDSVKDTISIITASVGGALLVIGAILAFSGANIPLGIGLMLAGAASLGTASGLNWDSLPDLLRGPVGEVVAIVSGALLALGAILAFSGAKVPLGIALMVAGAVGLATVTALNWDSIEDALRGPIGIVTELVSGALLVLGAVLAFSGVNIPLGIGLMVAGAAGLATVITVNWDSIKKSIDKVIDEIGKSISGMLNWAIDGINELFHIQYDGLIIAGVEIIPAFNVRLLNIPRIPTYAQGGFPDSGQAFIARENGIPEMVGTIGRRTAVANNDQIVESISVGVAEANSEQNILLREQNTLLRELLEKDTGVYLDGRALSDSVDKHKREQGRVLIVGGAL